MNALASSVVVTRKRFARPSSSSAFTPSSVDGLYSPTVFVNTSTSNRGELSGPGAGSGVVGAGTGGAGLSGRLPTVSLRDAYRQCDRPVPRRAHARR